MVMVVMYAVGLCCSMSWTQPPLRYVQPAPRARPLSGQRRYCSSGPKAPGVLIEALETMLQGSAPLRQDPVAESYRFDFVWANREVVFRDTPPRTLNKHYPYDLVVNKALLVNSASPTELLAHFLSLRSSITSLLGLTARAAQGGILYYLPRDTLRRHVLPLVREFVLAHPARATICSPNFNSYLDRLGPMRYWAEFISMTVGAGGAPALDELVSYPAWFTLAIDTLADRLSLPAHSPTQALLDLLVGLLDTLCERKVYSPYWLYAIELFVEAEHRARQDHTDLTDARCVEIASLVGIVLPASVTEGKVNDALVIHPYKTRYNSPGRVCTYMLLDRTTHTQEAVPFELGKVSWWEVFIDRVIADNADMPTASMWTGALTGAPGASGYPLRFVVRVMLRNESTDVVVKVMQLVMPSWWSQRRALGMEQSMTVPEGLARRWLEISTEGYEEYPGSGEAFRLAMADVENLICVEIGVVDKAPLRPAHQAVTRELIKWLRDREDQSTFVPPKHTGHGAGVRRSTHMAAVPAVGSLSKEMTLAVFDYEAAPYQPTSTSSARQYVYGTA